jgi:hypothetical protein
MLGASGARVTGLAEETGALAMGELELIIVVSLVNEIAVGENASYAAAAPHHMARHRAARSRQVHHFTLDPLVQSAKRFFRFATNFLDCGFAAQSPHLGQAGIRRDATFLEKAAVSPKGLLCLHGKLFGILRESGGMAALVLIHQGSSLSASDPSS